MCDRIAHLGNLLLGRNDGDAVHEKIGLNERLVGLVLFNEQRPYLVSHGIGISVFKHDIVDVALLSFRLFVQKSQQLFHQGQLGGWHHDKKAVGPLIRPDVHRLLQAPPFSSRDRLDAHNLLNHFFKHGTNGFCLTKFKREEFYFSGAFLLTPGSIEQLY